MVEIHTQIECKKCHQLFWAVYVNSAALPKSIEKEVECPRCKSKNQYAYEFSGEFPCIPKRWQFWKKRAHHIENHFSKNNLGEDIKLFPRHCICGEEVLIMQRRLK